MGKTCVPKRPERIITLNPASLGNAIALGIQPIGSVLDYDDQFSVYLEGKTKGLKSLGSWSEPSIERITLLKPDVTFGFNNNHQRIYSQLSAISPTVLYDWIGNIKLHDNWKKYFNFMAEVLDRKDMGKQVWQHYNERIKNLKVALGVGAASPKENRYRNKTLSFIILFANNNISVEPGNSFAGSIFRDLGLQLPEIQKYDPKGSVKLSRETLNLIDSDVIFVMLHGNNDETKRNFELLQRNQIWQQLKAVKQNHVYRVDPTIWRGRNPLAADAVIDDLYKYLVNTP
ncbi:MAG: iron-siderophore ABC transporter substrate-binding protein [Goleter apudmare HA4340-LM2]|nr:iron-siderophore ABC transporter substrate-binding protein [Goleter apudmare HA4340-LM2]